MLSKNQEKKIRSLHLSRHRAARRLFIAEGIKSVNEIVNSKPEIVREIYVEKGFNSPDWVRLGIQIFEVESSELERISLQKTPNKVLAVCSWLGDTDPDFDFSTQYTFYLDGIRDPGNFGTIIRLAAWFGIPRIFCSEDSCELYNPKVIQASMGAFLNVAVCYTGLASLKQQAGLSRIYGATLNGRDIYREQLSPGLIVIGNEAVGISESNMSFITNQLTIPGNYSKTESLNAAMAASIIVSEFFRRLGAPDDPARPRKQNP